MDLPARTVSPLIQARDDSFDGLPDSADVSPLVAANGVLRLYDDAAAPTCTVHVPGRVCRLHGYNFAVIHVQGGNATLRLTRAGPTNSDSSTRILSEIEPTNCGSSLLIPGYADVPIVIGFFARIAEPAKALEDPSNHER